MSIFELSPALRGGLCIALVFLIFAAVVIFAMSYERKKMGIYIFCFLCGLFSYIFLQMLCVVTYEKRGLSIQGENVFFLRLSDIYTSVLIILILCIAICESIMLENCIRWNRSHVDLMSVKESLDLLPSGVCFYYDGGLVKLCNPAMMSICREITGKQLGNGAEFWEYISSDKVMSDRDYETSINYYEIEEHPVIRAGDGRFYRFSRSSHIFRGRTIYEISAADITDEFEKQSALRAKEEMLLLTKKRLSELGDTVVKATAQKEMLAAKVRLHNEFGNALILAKRYMKSRNDSDRDNLITLWSKCIRLFFADEDDEPGGYRNVFMAAKDVGISIELDGDLPNDSDKQMLISMAMGECITNTFRHAGGDTIFVRTDQENDICRVTITNNGRPPVGRINETGGLLNLRKVAEENGVCMEIHCESGFVLELIFGGEQYVV